MTSHQEYLEQAIRFLKRLSTSRSDEELRRAGLHPGIFAAMKVDAVTCAENRSKCVICSKAIVENQVVLNLACDHRVHHECARQWFVHHKHCPRKNCARVVETLDILEAAQVRESTRDPELFADLRLALLSVLCRETPRGLVEFDGLFISATGLHQAKKGSVHIELGPVGNELLGLAELEQAVQCFYQGSLIVRAKFTKVHVRGSPLRECRSFLALDRPLCSTDQVCQEDDQQLEAEFRRVGDATTSAGDRGSQAQPDMLPGPIPVLQPVILQPASMVGDGLAEHTKVLTRDSADLARSRHSAENATQRRLFLRRSSAPDGPGLNEPNCTLSRRVTDLPEPHEQHVPQESTGKAKGNGASRLSKRLSEAFHFRAHQPSADSSACSRKGLTGSPSASPRRKLRLKKRFSGASVGSFLSSVFLKKDAPDDAHDPHVLLNFTRLACFTIKSGVLERQTAYQSAVKMSTGSAALSEPATIYV